MRLTLRTLLAYMDDILEPADHEDLGKKIEASDFATELIHRSRDTVRRLRLGAPPVMSEGSDDVLDSLDLGDANAVAEYLDNTLPPEQVAEFERMCLEPGTEPDMHLAEVASCHHVLTMVLGEPADVESDLKSRMYQLPAQLASGQRLRVEPAHQASEPEPAPPVAPPVQAAAPATTPAAPVAAPAVQPASTAENDLPDYLREAAAAKRRSRNWAIAATLLVFGAIGFWLMNPPEAELPADVASNTAESFDDGEIDIQGLDDMTGDATAGAASTADTPAPPFDPSAATGELAPVFVPETDSTSEPAPPFDPDTADPGTTSGETGEADVAKTIEPAADGTDFEMIEDVADNIPPAVGEPGATASVDQAATTEVPDVDLPATDAIVASGEEPVLIASSPEMPIPSEVPTETAEPAETEPAEPVGPRRFGNYLGNDDVLLRYNADQDDWIRVPPRSPISTGDQLLTLPRFFTHVVLADVNTYLSGGTRINIPLEEFETATSDAELNLEVIYGRAMFNAGLNGNRIAILVDDQLREFKLAGSSSLVVDVQRVFVPGNDYENEAAPTIATWYLTSGSVEWPTATGSTQIIEGQMVWKTIDGIDEIPEAIAELPEWIGREPMTNLQRSARDDLAKELEPGKQVEIRLMELNEGKGLGRREEVRILAAAASVYVGEFAPLVMALNDSEQNRAWDDHIHDLRQAMALSPNVAANVREAFVKIRGEEAARDLLEMVRGYNLSQIGETREAVQNGALAQLLRWLDHDSLDYRVLAINNIRLITGKKKGYRPDDIEKNRTKNLRRLWAEFESNELMPQL